MSLSNQSKTREHILEQVKEIVLSFVNDLPVQVYLFGSWSRGEERRTSDIDVGICSRTALSNGILTNIRMELEESTIPYRVDIVDMTGADQWFVEKIKEEGVVWKDCSKD